MPSLVRTAPGCNLHDAAETCRHCALSRRVLAPSDHVSVTFERHTMPIAHRDFCDAIQTWRNKDLPVSVFAPGKDGSIGFQREIVVEAGCDLNDTIEPRGN